MVCPWFGFLVQGDASAGDFGEDGFDGGSPDEGAGVVGASCLEQRTAQGC